MWNPIKHYRIMRRQNILLRQNYPSSAKHLIIYITISKDIVSGGIRSICAHFEETKKIKHLHGAEVVLSTGPNERLLLKYTKFDNNNIIYSFKAVLSYFKELDSIMIHVPEIMADKFFKSVSRYYTLELEKIKNVHINVMLQNIDLIKYMKSIKNMEKLGKVTCTTAHQKYTTLELRKKLGVSVHLLTPRGSINDYNRKIYKEKEDLIIISPDEHPLKSRILNMLREQLPKIKIRIISNMDYEDYKKLIEKAKWALTFGEGLDGYFCETIFSGGISFSVFNSSFFTEDFRELQTIYDNYDLLVKNMCSDIKRLDCEYVFRDYNNIQYVLLNKYYNNEICQNDLELFYRGLYTFK